MMRTTLELRDKIVGLLESLKDDGSDIDTGHYLLDDSSECFVTMGGVEYCISVKRREALERGAA